MVESSGASNEATPWIENTVREEMIDGLEGSERLGCRAFVVKGERQPSIQPPLKFVVVERRVNDEKANESMTGSA